MTRLQELEQIEEAWRAETEELMALVSRLQEENRRLQAEREEDTPSAAPGAISTRTTTSATSCSPPFWISG